MNAIISFMDSCNVKVYLVKKRGKDIFISIRIPNGIDREVKEAYSDNLSYLIINKDIVDYDYVHQDKNSVSKVNVNKIDLWEKVLNSLYACDEQVSLLSKENFSDDYNFIVILYENAEVNKKAYLFARYNKTQTWYKKGFKFAFSANGAYECKDEIIVLNGNIDCVTFDEDCYIFNDSNFEFIFNYLEGAKTLIESNKEKIASWKFLDDSNVFIDSIIQSGKTKICKFANAILKSKTDWENIEALNVKKTLESSSFFANISFDVNNRIICTSQNSELIIDILREKYNKQLITDDIIVTKGV